MRYAQIRNMDISNGKGIGIALFVQGCHFHCKDCFNPETWDFDAGKEWNDEIVAQFIKLADKSYISRISILGGEPLCDENVYEVAKLVNTLMYIYPDKEIWVYTGYTLENILDEPNTEYGKRRKFIARNADYLVDGQFVAKEKDLNLKFRGSANQHIYTHNEIMNVIELGVE